jgi:MYXO-CTERM domain-containing protein
MVGCQMSRAPAAPGAGSFLALFGLVGLVLRRRPRVTA